MKKTRCTTEQIITIPQEHAPGTTLRVHHAMRRRRIVTATHFT